MSEASYLARIERLRGPGAIRGLAPFALAAGFLLLAGLIAVAWIAAVASGRSQLGRADSRLESEARSVQAAFATEVVHADAVAGSLAASRALERALYRHDVSKLRRLVAGRAAAVFEGRRVLAGSVPAGAVTRSVVVSAGGKPLGRVVSYVALDGPLLRRLRAAAGMRAGDQLLLARMHTAGVLGRASDQRIKGSDYRRYAVELVGPPHPAVLEVVTRRSAIGSSTGRRIAWALLAALATFATILVATQAVVSTRRRHTSRVLQPSDMRALALVGDALASTHNPERLLPIILHAAMQTTGASAGRIVRNGEEVAREGVFVETADPLHVELANHDGITERTALYLYPPPQGFDERTTALAHSLAAQASVALENALLHGIVKRQAVTDELTGLANRRAFMEALGLELRRADRFGGSLALVLADLDDFKRVNDRFGHGVGDDLLRRFGETLQGRTREIDVCARLGGEEFALLLPETDLAGAESLAESLRVAVSELTVEAGAEDRVGVTASFGVGAFPETHTADDLMTAADLALYSAKRQGKNQVVTVSRNRA
jgi:diguanylate cyclase (GGDEF)-like protein